MINSYLSMLRSTQDQLMTDVADVFRLDVEVLSDVKCRVFSNRLFAEPADPHDANMRSMAEWGITMPNGTDIRLGDKVIAITPLRTVDIIVGEVVHGDTWQIAVRAWGNRPKLATPEISIVIYRYDIGLDDFVARPAQNVQIVYDRNQPKETPIRYTPAAATNYQGGWLVGGLDFDVQIEDRFFIDGLGCVVTEVLPRQPQHKEARFMMDIGGAR